MNPPAHPVCGLFPMMPKEELERLTDDIRRRGLLQPIVLLEGAVLDGRNRLAACRQAGVTPRFTEWRGEGSPLEWLIAQNVVRRHLSPSQRAVLALAVLPFLEAAAKERVRTGAARPRGAQTCAPLHQGSEAKLRAADQAARLFGASSRYVQVAKRVQQKCPALLPWVAAGTINLHEAASALRLPKKVLQRVREVLEATSPDADVPFSRVVRRAYEEYHHATAPARVVPYSSPAPQEELRLLSAPQVETVFELRLTADQLDALDRGAELAVTVAGRACLLRRR